MATLPTMTQISMEEINSLGAVNASGCVMRVYAALVSFDFKKIGSSFPKIETIQKLLNNSLTERTIYRAIAFLEEHNLIRCNKARHNGKTNKRRFVMLKRCAEDFVRRLTDLSGKIFPSNGNNQPKEPKTFIQQHDRSDTIRENKKENNFIYTKKSPNSFSRSSKRYISVKEQQKIQNEKEKRLKKRDLRRNSANYLFSRIISGVPIHELTEQNRKTLLQALLAKDNNFNYSWAKEYHPKLCLQLIDKLKCYEGAR